MDRLSLEVGAGTSRSFFATSSSNPATATALKEPNLRPRPASSDRAVMPRARRTDFRINDPRMPASLQSRPGTPVPAVRRCVLAPTSCLADVQFEVRHANRSVIPLCYLAFPSASTVATKMRPLNNAGSAARSGTWHEATGYLARPVSPPLRDSRRARPGSSNGGGPLFLDSLTRREILSHPLYAFAPAGFKGQLPHRAGVAMMTQLRANDR
jgi:hypothetical protein